MSTHKTDLIYIFLSFHVKYFKDIFEYSNKFREFQKVLYKIPSWTDEKINKEYYSFAKYMHKKFNLNENELLNLIYSRYNIHKKFNIPTINIFWYKSIKKIAKYFYENPYTIKENTKLLQTNQDLQKILNNAFLSFIPIKQILNSTFNNNLNYVFKQKHTQEEDTQEEDIQEEDTQEEDKPEEDTPEEDTAEEDTPEKSNKNSLPYLSSENNDDEYYKSDNMSNEKHINIPKYIFKKNNYNTYKFTNNH